MERGRLGSDGPTRRRASGRAAQARGFSDADDSEDDSEAQRAAGGPDPWSHHSMGAKLSIMIG